jgi:hypothetical protein
MGLHVLDLPNTVEAVWRGALFVYSCVLLGGCYAFITVPSQPLSRRLLMAALGLVILKSVFVNVERIDAPLFWEGLPVDTVWLFLTGVGLARWWVERQLEMGRPRPRWVPHWVTRGL